MPVEFQLQKCPLSSRRVASRRVGDLLCGARRAHAEGLTLLVADNKTGYLGVYLDHPGRPKPYLQGGAEPRW